MRKNQSALLFFVFFLLCPSLALAVESICPGGSAPRGDVKFCADFDNLAGCVTGREPTCWAQNSITDIPTGFRITSGGAAVGSGFAAGSGPVGSTGPGFSEVNLPGGPANQVSLRYYARYSRGYMTYGSNHFPSIIGSNPDSSCHRGTTLEGSMTAYFLYSSANCGVGGFDMHPNTAARPILKNNRWYLIEMSAGVDTACSNPSSPNGCNGTYKLSIDGQVVMNYTDLNWGGVTHGVKWHAVNGPRSYFHRLVPPWQPEVHFDNFVVATSLTPIGAAGGENPRGTADPVSPYGIYFGVNAALGRSIAPDCASNNHGMSEAWKDNPPTFETGIVHRGFTDTCNIAPLSDQAFKVTVPGGSTGGGMFGDRMGSTTTYIFPQQVLQGHIYLPSSNNYDNVEALSGFFGYGNTIDSKYTAMTIQGGKWGIIQRYDDAPTVVQTTSVSATTNTWHRFEIIVWNNQSVSLMIDNQRLLDKAPLPKPVDYIFNFPHMNGPVIGVIDYNGPSNFTVYYDDLGAGTASFWSCDGWGTDSCPFVNAQRPAAPTGLTVELAN